MLNIKKKLGDHVENKDLEHEGGKNSDIMDIMGDQREEDIIIRRGDNKEESNYRLWLVVNKG